MISCLCQYWPFHNDLALRKADSDCTKVNPLLFPRSSLSCRQKIVAIVESFSGLTSECLIEGQIGY